MSHTAERFGHFFRNSLVTALVVLAVASGATLVWVAAI